MFKTTENSLQYVDCHSHLFDDMFNEDLDKVIEKAKDRNVAAALVCSVTVRDFPKVLYLSEKYQDFVVPCLGIHPVQKDEKGEQMCVKHTDISEALSLIEKHKDVIGAVGEIGLDFQPRITPTSEEKDVQRAVLKAQVELANKLNIPINVHSRSAGKPTIDALKELKPASVLLHAFDGRPAVAMEGVKEGYFFSIPPSIIRSEQMKLVKQLPIENIVLETDSPGLGPVKGERNEPSNISVSCDYVAKIKGMKVEDVMKITTMNAIKIFPRLKSFINI
ncbi:hypothetical protein FSP39_017839 [Pinctada imbricata]|uniref:Uncharacterized protein n=1 Tax=Pinctada imbricata TaxID=66713 RepID=A0AA88XVL5_PINIB|nr:hypothetical protein FSP39_017839 [Pinctada imbricata]